MNYDYEDELERELARERAKQSRRKPDTSNRQPRSRAQGASSQRQRNVNPGVRNSAATVSTGAGSRNGTGASASSRAASRAAKEKKKKRIIMMIVAECFALLFIFSYAFFAKQWGRIQRQEFEPNNVKNNDLAIDTVEKMEGYWTIAVFGVDSRGKAVGKGTNADVNMICNINQDTGEIKLVSVFRDSYLNINDNNSYNKINQAYFQGGPEQAVKAMNKNMDLNITDYVTFNWKAVADAINILGGVDLEISKAEFYYINSFITETVQATGIASNHLKKAGMNHLDGVQAVAYGRLRLMDTDFARTERQRKIISLAFEKAKKANFSVLNNIMEVVFPQVATSIDMQDITNVALNVTKYHLGENGGFPFARGDANMGKKGACVIPQTLESNVIQLHQFLFGNENYQVSETVKTISAKIAKDSGMYNEGKPIGHVSTDGGYIPKPTKPAPETTEEQQETDETEESSSIDGSNAETSEGESSAGGNRPGGDASGWEPWETDANGNPVDPAWGNNGNSSTKPTKPGTTASPDEGGPGVPTTAAPPETSQTPESMIPSSAPETTAAVEPGRPGGTPESTAANQPGGIVTPPTTAPELTPGGPGSPGSDQSQGPGALPLPGGSN